MKINPLIIREPNKCPRCGGDLVLVTSETSIMTLDHNGRPSKSIYFNYENKINCINCGSKFNTIQDKFNLTFKAAFDKGKIIESFKGNDNNYNPFDDVSEF